MDEAVTTLKELMNLDSDHEVLFLHGGATTQFFQIPMNILRSRFFLAEENKWITLKLSTEGIRTINKKGLFIVVKELRAQGQHI